MTTKPAAAPAVAGLAANPLVPTVKRNVIDEYFGVKVSDPYRWLENAANPEVKTWNEAQNRQTRAFLDAEEYRPQLKERIGALLSAQSSEYTALQYKGGAFFAMKEQPPKQQRFLVVLKSIDDTSSERVVLDPNVADPTGKTAIDWYVASQDGKRVAISLSKGGSESGDVHVIDVATLKESGDVVPRVNGGTAGGSLAFTGDGKGFYYTRYPHEGERPAADLDFYQQVYFHKLGTPPSSDTYAIGKDFPRIAEVHLQASDDGHSIIASVGNGDGGEYAHYVLGADKLWTQLATFDDKILNAHFGHDGKIYLHSRKGAPRGKIVRLANSKTKLEDAETIVAEGTGVIEHFAPTRSNLYVVSLEGGPSVLRVIPLTFGGPKGQTKPETQVATLPISSVSFVTPLSGDDILYRNESYVDAPAWYRFSPSTAKPVRTALVKKASFDMGDVEVTRKMFKSKDGTAVPVNILAKKGTSLDGSHPVLLTGYGGYGVSLSPRLRPMNRLWLDQGGIFAEVNLRGGGEFGEEWHLRGNLTRKQNVFDDFAACAKFLIDNDYTRPEHLAIMGGSNGGLLMGAEIVQHPDLYRAVVALVGIYDMLRVELTPNGAFNVTEFGTVKDEAQFRALYAYSPYHQVRDAGAYPSALFMTGANDPRVDPYNSRKMVARLQAATSSGHPVLLRTSGDTGHGMGTPLGARIEENTDIFTFLFHELGMTFRAAP